MVLATLLLGWFGFLAASVLILGKDSAVLAITTNPAFMQHLPDHVRLLRANGSVYILTSLEDDFVNDIYNAGALIVFPSLKSGCLDLRTLRKSI